MNLTSNKKYISNREPIDEIIYSARLLSLTKTRKWLHKFIDLGLVVISGASITIDTNLRKVKFKTFIDVMIEGFTRRYGDNWDVHLQKTDDFYTLCFFTIFPTTEISNSTGLTHTIKDLIVSYPINYNGNSFIIDRIEGTRLSLFRKEYDADYCHSHLRSSVALNVVRNPFTTDTFCIGSGDLSLLEGVLASDFTVRNLEAFLYEVDATIRWESLSGTPYVYIRDIVAKKENKAQVFDSDVSFFTEMIIGNPIDINYYISNNRYKIKLDDKYEKFVQNIIENNSSVNYIKERVLCNYNQEAKTYYTAKSNTSRNSGSLAPRMISNEKPYMIYNGQKKHITIRQDIDTSTQTVSNETYIIHPKFLENVHKHLEEFLHNKIIRLSAISRYYSAEYISSNSAQNTVSL